MESYQVLMAFFDYLEYYPGEDEPGFDGIHDGGIKWILKDAPETVKKAYDEYLKLKKEMIENGLK